MIKLRGIDISEYSIKLDDDASVDIVNAADSLRANVLKLTGYELPIVRDEASPTIHLTVGGDSPEVGRIAFGPEGLEVSGGHYVSTVGAVKELISMLGRSTELAGDLSFTASYDSVPLTNERYPEMKLVWNDEFDFEDDQYDRRKWVQRVQMAASDMYNSTEERNVKTEDGKLILRSWKENEAEVGKPYSTPMSMTTYDSCSYCYGYLEMRAAVPFGKGCWPSFWTNQRRDMRAKGQEWMPEIDIFEVFGSKNSLVPNIHKWYFDSSDKYHVQLDSSRKTAFKFENCENLSEEFHTYGFYWDEKRMIFSVDGVDYCEMDITAESGDFGKYKGMEGFHTPNYIILNNFLFTPEASWIPDGAMVDGNVEYPVTYKIDYLRLWQGENGVLLAPGLEVNKAK